MTKEQVDELICAVRRIAYGDQHDPTGLEALAMSLSGDGTPGLNDSVAKGLHDIADAIREIAEKLPNP